MSEQSSSIVPARPSAVDLELAPGVVVAGKYRLERLLKTVGRHAESLSGMSPPRP